MRILKIHFIILLLIYPFGELLRFDIGNDIRFKPIDILTGIIFICWIILYLTRRIKVTEFSFIYLMFPTVGLISLLINSFWLQPIQLLASGFYLIRWICYFGIFLVVSQFDDAFKKKMIILLVFDGIFISVLGYIQYFFFTSLKPLYNLGWDDHMYRMFSVFLDPNYTGGFFVLFLLFIGGLLYKLSTIRKKPAKIKLIKHISLSKRPVLIILYSLLSITLIATLLTFSRSTLLMLIAGGATFFILIRKRKFILILLGIIAIFIVVISSYFYVENINLFRQASTSARLGNYQNAAKIISEHPILGVGFNSYRYAKERYHIQSGWVNAPSHADAGVDNSYLFVFVTTGIIGIASYLLLWGYILKRAFIQYKMDSNIFSLIFISSTIGIFVHAMFINSLFYPAMMLWMWIMYGLMEKTSR